MNEGIKVAILLQGSGDVKLFLGEDVLQASDGPSLVMQASDQISLDVERVVGLEIQVAVSVRGLPVHCGLEALIISPSE